MSVKDQGSRAAQLAEEECASSILLQCPSTAFFPTDHFSPLEMWTGHTNNKLPTESSSSVREEMKGALLRFRCLVFNHLIYI